MLDFVMAVVARKAAAVVVVSLSQSSSESPAIETQALYAASASYFKKQLQKQRQNGRITHAGSVTSAQRTTFILTTSAAWVRVQCDHSTSAVTITQCLHNTAEVSDSGHRTARPLAVTLRVWLSRWLHNRYAHRIARTLTQLTIAQQHRQSTAVCMHRIHSILYCPLQQLLLFRSHPTATAAAISTYTAAASPSALRNN